jgi:hypothetical protein
MSQPLDIDESVISSYQEALPSVDRIESDPVPTGLFRTLRRTSAI